ncbi:MAG: response regulator [bacterium]|nr:response regulator [bacterium]
MAEEKNKKILIVEDEQAMLKALETAVGEHGYTTVRAINGTEGLQQAISLHPDLIILDILMPQMDGIQMLEKLRADPWGQQVPVIILTNVDANERMIQNIVKNFPTRYMVKAYSSLESMAMVIEEMLQLAG